MPSDISEGVSTNVFDALAFIDAAFQLDECHPEFSIESIRRIVGDYMATLKSRRMISDHTVEADPDNPGCFLITVAPVTPVIRHINLRHRHKLPPGESTRRNRRRRRGRARSWFASYFKF